MVICESVEKLESLQNMDVLLVRFSDGTTAHWCYDYGRALEYVGQEVIVDYRNDVYKGNVVTMINTFTMPSKVNTVEKHENVRLFSDVEDNQANLSFNDLMEGETKNGCIFYCISQELKTSDKAVWNEYLIRDKSFRVAKLRIFDGDNPNSQCAGSYCMAALTKNKYGLQSKLIVPANGECRRNPEIDISIDFVRNYFATDEHAMSFISQTGFIDKMEQVIDYEKGYALVRLAMELSMCEQLYNITNNVDVTMIGHALLLSYAHNCVELSFSPEVRNIIVAIKYKWPNTQKLMSILDPGEMEKRPDEYIIYKSIRNTINTILETRKSYK